MGPWQLIRDCIVGDGAEIWSHPVGHDAVEPHHIVAGGDEIGVA